MSPVVLTTVLSLLALAFIGFITLLPPIWAWLKLRQLQRDNRRLLIQALLAIAVVGWVVWLGYCVGTGVVAIRSGR